MITANGLFVYVVCKGERGEGHSPEAVYGSLSDAKASCKGIEFKRCKQLSPKVWRGVVNEVDEIYIYKFRVK